MSPSRSEILIDEDTSRTLEKLASLRNISPQALLREVVDDYVDRHARRLNFHAAGRDAWEEYEQSGLFVSDEAADDWLASLEAGDLVEPPPCRS